MDREAFHVVLSALQCCLPTCICLLSKGFLYGTILQGYLSAYPSHGSKTMNKPQSKRSRETQTRGKFWSLMLNRKNCHHPWKYSIPGMSDVNVGVPTPAEVEPLPHKQAWTNLLETMAINSLFTIPDASSWLQPLWTTGEGLTPQTPQWEQE